MNFVALKMLTGDWAKYLGLIFHDRVLHVPARKPDVHLRWDPEAHRQADRGCHRLQNLGHGSEEQPVASAAVKKAGTFSF